MAGPMNVGGVRGGEFPFPGPTESGPTGNRKSFGDVLSQALERADDRVTDASAAIADLANGQAASTHEVMIKVEEAHLALQWTIQLRNKALEAYQEIMRMPL
ncbi:MAG: flagellar hook-basal body complex protein FliE [Elusimicrobia bacterium]|nr:flagellar hook-basal body complex protein FliE [Elusimicrobiota bacterium]